MPSIKVDAQAIAELGASLSALADELAGHPDRADADRWALGAGESAAVFADLVERWRHARLGLAATLHELGEAAACAGGAYLDTESAIGGRLLGGGQW